MQKVYKYKEKEIIKSALVGFTGTIIISCAMIFLQFHLLQIIAVFIGFTICSVFISIMSGLQEIVLTDDGIFSGPIGNIFIQWENVERINYSEHLLVVFNFKRLILHSSSEVKIVIGESYKKFDEIIITVYDEVKRKNGQFQMNKLFENWLKTHG